MTFDEFAKMVRTATSSVIKDIGNEEVIIVRTSNMYIYSFVLLPISEGLFKVRINNNMTPDDEHKVQTIADLFRHIERIESIESNYRSVVPNCKFEMEDSMYYIDIEQRLHPDTTLNHTRLYIHIVK